jgi:hypothetical protein
LKIGDISVYGSLRTRVETWNWFEAGPAAQNGYTYSGNTFKLGIKSGTEHLDWQLEFEAPVLAGLPSRAVAPAPQLQLGLGANYYLANGGSRTAASLFAKQAFITFKNRFGAGRQLRLGRFEFNDGAEITPASPALAALKKDRIAQRLIGSFGWSHVGRSFDGAHYTGNHGGVNVTILGFAPTRGVFQTDGWGNLKIGVFYGAVSGQLRAKRHNTDWRILGMYYQDWRNIVKTDNRPSPVRSTDFAGLRSGTYGGHVLHAVETSAGTVDALLWAVAQPGRWGGIGHHGVAYALEGGWQPDVLPRLRPWIRGGFFHGSGDANPQDGKHGTFFQVLPTPRPYARFPFFNLMNNEDVFGSLALRPSKTLTIRSEVHGLKLANRNDLWYQGGGAFQPWTFGYVGRPSNGNRGLATLYDVSADCELTPHFALGGYFGRAIGHSVIRSIYPNGKNANLGYVELGYRF